jgi:hypothetical protein
MARTITQVYTCAVCGKTTTRLLGFSAVLKLPDDGEGGGQASRHVAVLGTCAAHRDRIPEQFAAQAAARGEVISVLDELVPLRPAQVEVSDPTAWHLVNRTQVDRSKIVCENVRARTPAVSQIQHTSEFIDLVGAGAAFVAAVGRMIPGLRGHEFTADRARNRAREPGEGASHGRMDRKATVTVPPPQNRSHPSTTT